MRGIELGRDLKSRFTRRLRYQSRYADLDPPDYTRTAFQAEAKRAPELYEELLAAIGTDRLESFDRQYCHPVWLDAKRRLGDTVAAGLKENFLDDPVLRPQMVRRGWSALQAYEQDYLLSRPSKLTAIIRRFKESKVGWPHLECAEYQCSSNSLGHLYYFIRILEKFPVLRERTHTTIEFGGGYGNFGRIHQELLPSGAYVIVDFPELLVVQNLFLSLNQVPALLCTSTESVVLQPGVIHLVPVQMVPELEINADLFASHFALSETPHALQALIAAKRFFGADWMYLTGQYTNRQPGADWEPHGPLHADIKGQYEIVEVEDFPVTWGYELAATRKVLEQV